MSEELIDAVEAVLRAGFSDHRQRAIQALVALGIPAATLSALRDGSMVAFPRHLTKPIRLAFHAAHERIEDGSAYPEGSPDYEWEAMLAAAKDARHD